MVLLGLAGKKLSDRHTLKTAQVLNKMFPKFLAALRFVRAPGLKMFDGYKALSEYKIVQELYKIIERLELST